MKDLNRLNIVVIGGGTSTYTLLRGLKNYFRNITAYDQNKLSKTILKLVIDII